MNDEKFAHEIVWIDNLGEEYIELCRHPYMDKICLMGTSGWIRWLPYIL